MSQHVLLISLGPVQELIASARRCRDLWFGSWVLSELAKAAAAGAVDALGGDEAIGKLVFPAPAHRQALEPGSDMSVANKIVVRVPGGAEQVRDVAEKGRERMKVRLRALREKAFERIERAHFDIDRARLQVDELVELIWVAVLEAGGAEGEGGYAWARDEAERLLAARKRARAWSQPSWAEDGVRKCSLDGERESVLDERIYGRAAVITPEERRRGYGVRDGERLCGVGSFKRWGVMQRAGAGPHVERFFSTAHLAARPLMIGVGADPRLDGAFRELRRAAKEAAEEFDVAPRSTGFFGGTDGGILFSQRLVETLVELGYERESEVVRVALDTQRAFLQLAGRGEPVAYYAILVADGDGMGKRIEGMRTEGEHRDLSQRLARFARGARTIVEDDHGSLVYSGGDDVLAFLPLHRAIECARALADSFYEVTGGATLSAGLAIVHYVDSMSDALEVARDAEKVAKAYPDKAHPKKNALTVALDKRSGGTTVVSGHWDALAPRLLALVNLHLAEAIPDKAGHELDELAHLTEDAKAEDLPTLRAIQRSEALRILGRKRARRGREKLAAETLDELRSLLGGDPAALGREIGIAALIAKAKAQAAPSAEQGA